MRGRKHPRWNGDLSVCAYCLGPNDRQGAKTHNGKEATRCSTCYGRSHPVPPPMDQRERAKIEAMLAKPTWEPVR